MRVPVLIGVAVSALVLPEHAALASPKMGPTQMYNQRIEALFIRLDADRSELGSPLQIASWFEQHLRCDALAIGDVSFDGDSTIVSIHSSKLGLAMKAIKRHPFGSKTCNAEVL